MKKLLTILGFLGTGFFGVQAQSLSAGDIAIIGYAGDNPDAFSFVLMADVISGTEINFTDNAWDSAAGDFLSNEGTVTWTANTNLPTGTIITIDNDGGWKASRGMATGNSFFLSTGGDQVIAYQGSSAPYSILYAVTYGPIDWINAPTSLNSNRSFLPDGLTDGTNAVSVGNFDNAYYDGDTINMPGTLMSDISDATNWNGDDDRSNHDPAINGKKAVLPVTFSPAMGTDVNNYNEDFGTIPTGTASGSSSFTIGGTSLNGDITLTAPTGFEIRTGANAYASTVTLTPSGGNVLPTAIDVRFNPSTDGSVTDTIQITSSGAFKNQILVMGEAVSQPQIGFTMNSVNLDEGDTIEIGVYVLNKGNNTVTAELTFQSMTNAIVGQHFDFPNSNQAMFDQTTGDTLTIQMVALDDLNSGPRFRDNKFGFLLTGAGTVSGNDSFEISIAENDYMMRSIASIKQDDANGNAISTDSLFAVSGVVIGNNTRTSGMSFTIHDGTAGISNYIPSFASDFSYVVNEGDSIYMRGRLTQFNGLTQLDFLDTIRLIASNATVKSPDVMDMLSEASENNLVRINNVMLTTPIPTWSVSGSGSNYEAYNTVTNDTFEIRILPTSGLAGLDAPTGLFDVIGIGGQYDFSEPRDGGYQLMPYASTQVIQDSLDVFDLLTPANNASVQIEGDTAQNFVPTWEECVANFGAAAPTYNFHLDAPTGDFSNPILTLPADNSGMDEQITLNYKAVADALSSTLTPGNSLTLKWTVSATSGTSTEWAESQYLLTLERDALTGIITVNELGSVYPNPAQQTFTVEIKGGADQLTILDAQGKLIQSMDKVGFQTTIKTTGMENGVYFVRILQGEKQSSIRLVITNR